MKPSAEKCRHCPMLGRRDRRPRGAFATVLAWLRGPSTHVNSKFFGGSSRVAPRGNDRHDLRQRQLHCKGRLVAISKKRGRWKAEATEEGRYFIEQGS